MFKMEEEKGDEQKQNGFMSKLLKTRTILVNGEVDQDLAEKVISQLVVLDAESHDPIRMIVTSNGGHIDSGYAIHDMMGYVESEITTLGAGWVASIAVPILFGAPKKKRYSLPNTRFLIHQPSGGVGGQASDIRIEAKEILRLRQRLNELLAAETGQTIEKVSKDCDRNYWMSAEEAVEYGIVYKIVHESKEIA